MFIQDIFGVTKIMRKSLAVITVTNQAHTHFSGYPVDDTSNRATGTSEGQINRHGAIIARLYPNTF